MIRGELSRFYWEREIVMMIVMKNNKDFIILNFLIRIKSCIVYFNIKFRNLFKYDQFQSIISNI